MRIFFSLLAVVAAGSLSAQITANMPTLNFPNTNELVASNQEVMLYNPSSFPVTVTDVDLFEYYGDLPFSVSDTNFTIAPADSFKLTVSFLPEHNLNHQLSLVLKTNSGFGHTPIELAGQGEYSKAYYSSTQNLSEEPLKIALKARLAQGYTALSYSVARDNMYATLDNLAGTVECVYTGRTASFSTRSGANANSFNTEHTFPQGFFNQGLPMRSDIHHLFPTDVMANSRRSNDPFGVVGNATWTMGGSKSGGGKFEPRDAQKGASARAMMYFVIRYQDYANHFQGQESVLRGWHNLYPASADEQNRNAGIFNLQNNRNPFVDYPQFEERITNFVSNSNGLPIEDIYLSDDTIFLAQGTGNYTYSFVLVNNGNGPIGFTNLSASDPNLSLSGPTTLNIPAGEAAVVALNFDAALTYSTQLSFSDTRVPSQNYTVPVFSGPSLSTRDFLAAKAPRFYPNPAKEKLQVSHANQITKLSICNLSGMCQNVKPESSIDLTTLAPGLYIINAELKNGALMQQKLIVR
jgi:hypothetical protein